jgi:hypothetical protein
MGEETEEEKWEKVAQGKPQGTEDIFVSGKKVDFDPDPIDKTAFGQDPLENLRLAEDAYSLLVKKAFENIPEGKRRDRIEVLLNKFGDIPDNNQIKRINGFVPKTLHYDRTAWKRALQVAAEAHSISPKKNVTKPSHMPDGLSVNTGGLNKELTPKKPKPRRNQMTVHDYINGSESNNQYEKIVDPKIDQKAKKVLTEATDHFAQVLFNRIGSESEKMSDNALALSNALKGVLTSDISKIDKEEEGPLPNDILAGYKTQLQAAAGVDHRVYAQRLKEAVEKGTDNGKEGGKIEIIKALDTVTKQVVEEVSASKSKAASK